MLRGKKVEVVPGLATRWRQTSPTTWVFDLRRGVKWHDGSDFTADDVVFSVLRAQGPTSGFRVYANALGTPRRIDSHTVEFTTAEPSPIVHEMASNIMIMSRAWAGRNKVERSQDFTRSEETHAARNAMGTGPYRLVSHEPDVKTVFKKNPNWWGIAEGYFEGNVTDVVYTPLASDATRLAALASGDLDFVLDPSPQDIERLRKDPGIRIYEIAENTVFFVAMDQHRGELLHSSVKGRNPLKDLRVRRAIYHAIDMDAIARTALRGFGRATAIVMPNPESVPVPPAMDKRLAHDPALARRLLAEAGYPNGFSVGMDCDLRWDKVCTALAGMLAKVGITLELVVANSSTFFAKLRRLESSLYVSGWVGSQDAMFTLQPIYHSRDDNNGDWNIGNFRDPDLDAAIDRARVELDPAKRRELMIEAVRRMQEGIYMVPLYRRLAPWASRANVEVVQRPDMTFEARWAKVKPR
ncbi:ABC transporter substrate-binding protein [Usitatibacter palustris]|uniref:Periplasmic dipeptide transport protein n=1 Tax=Usitatibacter palustris TaxID=2732487 RepID=A0A6M4H519_9PROT|nr:ABC transporter substrate-binding protein [Usitatibacter palustris]QJR13793.1 Periplasmic dipeptide transport protein [Usitatibacter palustris]